MSANLETIRAHYEAMARGDLDGGLAALAPDVEWKEAAGGPLAGTSVGREEIVRNVFDRVHAEWTDWRVEVGELVDGGETIVALNTYHGTYRATGRSMSARVAHVFRFRDGLIASFEQVVDSAALREAMEADA